VTLLLHSVLFWNGWIIKTISIAHHCIFKFKILKQLYFQIFYFEELFNQWWFTLQHKLDKSSRHHISPCSREMLLVHHRLDNLVVFDCIFLDHLRYTNTHQPSHQVSVQLLFHHLRSKSLVPVQLMFRFKDILMVCFHNRPQYTCSHLLWLQLTILPIVSASTRKISLHVSPLFTLIIGN